MFSNPFKAGSAASLVCAAVLCALNPVPAGAAEQRPGLQPCRLEGVEYAAWCGKLQRPLDPLQPQGVQIDVHYAVLPALARNRKPDAVMFFAGGPGQSAIDLAGSVSRLMARVSNRRDIVLVDQRGTGRTAPLRCPDTPPTEPLVTAASPEVQTQRLRDCGAALQKLPHGDLRQYTTVIASQDADAVRRALGLAQVNLVGGSYGTRAALDYLRQFPQAVRRTVIDGVAPPDMVLPASFSPDNQAALDAVFIACQTEPGCRQRHPGLRARWQALMAGLPREVSVMHPVTGALERITVTRDMVLSMVRMPLYVPALAAALPVAIERAADGRFEALLGLSSGVGGRSTRISEGMHFSVVCAEDLPRMTLAALPPAGADFGDAFARQYRSVCEVWPRGSVPAEFYPVPPAASGVLVLSGGIDPVTPPHHGERVAKALGAKARHVVVPNAGHGVMALPCMRDVLFRFIDAETDGDALKVEADCARSIPRPTTFVPVEAPR